MSEEDQSEEKTEQPSQKRLKEAKEKGQVLRSKEFNSTLILVAAALFILFSGQFMARQLLSMMHYAFEFDLKILTVPILMTQKLYQLVSLGLFATLPFLGFTFCISLFAPVLIGGWVFSSESFTPQFSRLSPLKGLKRIFSLKGLIEMLKALFKFIIIAVVGLVLLKLEIPRLLNLSKFALEPAIVEGLYIIAFSFFIISFSLSLIALIDVPFQWMEHQKQLRMTHQELKDEYKETEGKPEVKSYIRRAQQEIAKRRMITEVPKADVILTNPTHYSVALQYKTNGNRAPVLLAKGKDLIALQINKIAIAHQIPMLTLPPLTRAIYYSTEINTEIPKGLYVAVAQVLAYIFQLKDKNDYERQPDILRDLPIPDELKREAKE